MCTLPRLSFHKQFTARCSIWQNKIQIDSGRTKTISHAILRANYGHVTASYIQRCRVSQFKALSEKILFTLLQQLQPSQQHSLADLDRINADGMVSQFLEQ